AVSKAIADHPTISQLVRLDTRHKQVAVQSKSPISTPLVWQVIQELAQKYGLQSFRSSFAMDLVVRGVSKTALTKWVATMIPDGTHVLVVGDKGVWPGNDYDLLTSQC